MKTKAILTVIFAVFTVLICNAQVTNFIVQNGTAKAYLSVIDAYEAASVGDTIYLPGNIISLPTIEKGLVWIGAGCNPDSTLSTLPTEVTNNTTIIKGAADQTNFQGIHFQGLLFGDADDDVEGIRISRCYIRGSTTLKSSPDTVDIDIKLTHNIFIGTVSAAMASNVGIDNNIFQQSLHYFYQSVISNNIFLPGNYGIYYSDNNVIQNNVFIYNYVIRSSSYNLFKNNLIHGAYTFPNGTNLGENNVTGALNTEIFINEGANVYNFAWQNDYHLNTTSASGQLGLNAGTDSTNIGIYGGLDPWKEGMTPANPHISEINIAPETTTGLLPVEIKVAGQEK